MPGPLGANSWRKVGASSARPSSPASPPARDAGLDRQPSAGIPPTRGRIPKDLTAPPVKFSGFSSHNLDAKGRVFVPKRIQAKLPLDEDGQHRVVLGPGNQNCVYLFTPEAWELREEQLDSEPFAEGDDLLMQRFVYGMSFETTLDKSSRLLVPEKLRDFAQLDGEVALIGVKDRVELWNADRWREQEAAAMAGFDRLAPLWAAGANKRRQADPGPPPGEGGAG